MSRNIIVFALLIGAFVTISEAVSFDKDLSMTFREKQTLDEFKARVQPLLKADEMKTDIYLIRWLRAKNFDVNAAETMLKENLRWRQEKKIDSIHLENFEDVERDFPTSLDTYDKEGRPVVTIDILHWNIRDAVITGRGPRILRYLDMVMENVTDQVFERQKRGMNVTQWKALVNAEGFNMINHGCVICIPVWIQFVYSLENHFPGWLDELIVIESPSAVNTIVDILKPFLSRQTKESLRVLGMNRNVWMPYLDTRISREERRRLYGGTKPDKKLN